jgi:hypothetical protein
MEQLPSINDIRRGLATIPDALSNDRNVEGARPGNARVHVLSDPEEGFGLDGPPSDKGIATDDTPNTIFEVPPEIDETSARRSLDDAANGPLEEKVKVKGIDALAWYVPFHFTGVQNGIYISSTGVLKLVRDCLSSVSFSKDFSEDLTRKLDIAFYALLRHETFHFGTECMASGVEILNGHACYLDGFRNLRNSQGIHEREEALANAYMLRGFRHANSRYKGAQMFAPLKAYMRHQPSGYREGGNFVLTKDFLSESQLLVKDYSDCAKTAWNLPIDSIDATGLYPNLACIDHRRCPIIFLDEYGVFDALGINLGFIPRLHEIFETKVFEKQLRKLHTNAQIAWNRTKTKLAQGTSLNSLDFKKWSKGGPNCFSVRVSKSVRAHLRIESSDNRAYALEIGEHKAMGHG